MKELELFRLRLVDFRAFVGVHELELGRITVLTGANGLGKTTLFDAIDWALFGERSRLGSSPSAFPNLWEPRQPRVELETTRGLLSRDQAGATLGGTAFRPTQLLLDPAVFAKGAEADVALRRLIYLPQQEIRDLVEGDESSRSFLVAALAGVPNAERFARNVERTLGDISARIGAGAEQRERLFQRRAELEGQLVEQRQALLQAQSDGAIGQGITLPDLSSLTETTVAARQKVEQARERQFQLQERIRRLDVTRQGLQLANERARRLDETLAVAQLRKKDLASRTARAHELLTESSETYKTALAARDARLGELAKLQDEERRLQASIDAFNVRAGLEEARERLTARGVELKSSNDELKVQLTSAVAAETEARRKLESARAAVQEERNRASRRNQAQRELDVLEVDLLETKRRREQAVSESKGNEQRVQAVETQLATARRRGGISDRKSERLAVLVQELAALRDPNDSKCPVCAHDHSSAAALQEHMTSVLKELQERSDVLHEIQQLDAERSMTLGRLARDHGATETMRARVVESERSVETLRGRIAAIDAEKVGDADGDVLLRTATQEFETSTRRRTETEKRFNDSTLMLDSCRAEWRSANHALQQHLAAHTTTDLQEALARHAECHRATDEVRSRLDVDEVEIRTTGDKVAEHRRSRTLMTEETARLEAEVQSYVAERRVLTETIESLSENARREDVQGDTTVLFTVVENRLLEWTREASALTAEVEREQRALATLQLVVKLSSLPSTEAELSALRRQLESVDFESVSLARAKDRLTEIKEGVRVALESESLAARNRCQGIIDAVMKVLSPHRHLNTVKIEPGGGIRLMDESLEKPVNAVEYSSAGQMNLIGLAVFFGIGLGTRGSTLQALMLDEPVQNLDDVNILNFADLVRGLARSHQVILSTADSNFADLLRAKLGPWAIAEKQSVVIHEFLDFDRHTGPIIKTYQARRFGELPGFE